MDIIEAIKRRHSTRAYIEEKYSDATLQKINSLFEQIKPLKDEYINWTIEKDDKNTGKIFSDVDDNWKSRVCYGFQGEQIILKLTQLSYNTLWRAIGGERPAEILFGHAKNKSMKGSIARLLTGNGNRKPLSTFVKKDVSKISELGRACFELCRLAPSGMNKQSWKFDENGNNIIIEITGKSSINALDFGIVISHAYLFLKEKKKEITLHFENDYKCILNFQDLKI